MEITTISRTELPNTSDILWQSLYLEGQGQLAREPILKQFLHPVLLDHNSFDEALAALLAQKLECPTLSQKSLTELCLNIYRRSPEITQAARRDLIAIKQRDPACDGFALPFLYYKGFQGLQLYRLAHAIWQQERRYLAGYLQSRISETFAMDIHPAAQIGCGILIDHATSIVIGETAVVGNDVSMLHEVTLGGTGKQSGDRHPKVASGVLIGAGAKILGNVNIGEGAKVGAGSVVLQDVEPHCTVAGIPAKPVGICSQASPALEMDHSLDK